MLADGLLRLEAAGADFIAMPCNTAHMFFEQLRKTIRVPLLNMVELTVASLQSETALAVLATRGTIAARLYQSALEQKNISAIWTEQLQEKVDETLAAVKRKAAKAELTGLWSEIERQAKVEGASTLLVACTDLNYALEETNLPVVDATRILAQATVAEYLRRK
jgi:aspartate racemase